MRSIYCLCDIIYVSTLHYYITYFYFYNYTLLHNIPEGLDMNYVINILLGECILKKTT